MDGEGPPQNIVTHATFQCPQEDAAGGVAEYTIRSDLVPAC